MTELSQTVDAVDAGELPASPSDRTPAGVWRTGCAAAAAWALLGAVTLGWPNRIVGFADWPYTDEFGRIAIAVAALMLVIAFSGSLTRAWSGNRAALAANRLLRALKPAGPWLVAAALLLVAWQILTAKLGWLPAPFFAPPQSLIDVFAEDWRRLGISTWYSARLLVQGLVVGSVIGFVTGVWIGWSRIAGYWVHPLLRFLGPVPASALLPLAFFFAPSSHVAAVFLIALAAFFPIAVLTWSGIAGVNRTYYDVARTLGASEAFLVFRVAIPAALPQVFVGFFMALGATFSTLITAEMMGVKAGLSWYLQWSQGWAAYANMYAALLVMAALCSGLITLLFTIRDRVLSWQKGTVKW
ncbi:MAG: ABC transporter permease [Lautropia sp.]